jgi:hypothetical protein
MGTTVALVAVLCDTGASPSSVAFYVFDAAGSSSDPHLAQVLLNQKDNWYYSGHASIAGDQVTLAVSGYSTSTIPRYSPDVFTSLSWTWQNGGYRETSQEPSHYQLP